MGEILREANSIKWLLDGALDRLDALREACEQVGADDAAASADEAADRVRDAISSVGDIWLES